MSASVDEQPSFAPDSGLAALPLPHRPAHHCIALQSVYSLTPLFGYDILLKLYHQGIKLARHIPMCLEQVVQ